MIVLTNILKFIYLGRGKRVYLLEFNQFRLHQQITESCLYP